MKTRLTTTLTRCFSFMLMLSLLCTVNSAFAAEAVQTYEATEVVANEDSVPIYNVNDGNNFYEIAQTIRARDYESIIGFDVNGNKLFDCTSYLPSKAYTSSVTRQNFYANYGTTIVHNHPSSNSFSSQDLYTEASYQTPRLIAIGNKYTYVIEPTTSGWGDPTAMQDYYNQRYNIYYAEAAQTVQNLRLTRSQVLNYPETPDDGSCLWYCINQYREFLRANPNGKMESYEAGIWVTHRVMQDVAQHFNMLYYRCETDSFDFTSPTTFYSEAVARRQYQDYSGRYW